jgi:sulfur oxidation c-type cytochrome SoxA/sulfur oxidation c-type cytochrome SoxX
MATFSELGVHGVNMMTKLWKELSSPVAFPFRHSDSYSLHRISLSAVDKYTGRNSAYWLLWFANPIKQCMDSHRLNIGAAFLVFSICLTGCIQESPAKIQREIAYGPVLDWQSRATPESKGSVVEIDGKRQQIRYGWGGFARISENYEQWPSHSYSDTVRYPAPTKAVMPAGLVGDPEKGKEIFKSRKKGPCTACHTIQDADAWPLGNVGFDLRIIGDRGSPDQLLYQVIYDPRVVFGPDSPMPPFGLAGILTEAEIVHLVAFLQTQKAKQAGIVPNVSADKNWDPNTREVVKPDYGDELDPVDNPGLIQTENIAVPLWSKTGPTGSSCETCHGAIDEEDDLRPLGVIESMVGFGANSPKWMEKYGRMMSIEDFIAVHSPETTGIEMPAQSKENLTMSVLVRMQSNGLEYGLDTAHPAVQAAIERGKELFHRQVGKRHSSCAGCHTGPRGGADKFLGGRYLANVESGLVNHPYWRTSQQRLYDIRTRFQWCMTPLGTNYLPGDSPEYADLETYIVSRQLGKKVTVPRQSH